MSSDPFEGGGPIRLTVAVPAYNHERYIRRCLDSLRPLKTYCTELILIDDGSRDDTYGAAQAWVTENPAVFAQVRLLRQENRGIARTLNTMIDMARGEFVLPIASDDELIAETVDGRIALLEAHPEWSVLVGDGVVIDEQGKELMPSGVQGLHGGDLRALADGRLLCWELILRWSFVGSTYMLRTSYFRSGERRWRPGLQAEDRDFILRILARDELGFVPIAVSRYRWHPNTRESLEKTKLAVVTAVALGERQAAPLFKGLKRLALLVNGWYLDAAVASQTGEWSKAHVELAYRTRKLAWAILLFLHNRRIEATLRHPAKGSH
ncbi:MAG TPA: glycosyltransferase family A protein [Candidatus Thermoplasmatota archaeon]|nr:glycosyltransferase family A protein [Candidatus Thermoplasmatota archaeon]